MSTNGTAARTRAPRPLLRGVVLVGVVSVLVAGLGGCGSDPAPVAKGSRRAKAQLTAADAEVAATVALENDTPRPIEIAAFVEAEDVANPARWEINVRPAAQRTAVGTIIIPAATGAGHGQVYVDLLGASGDAHAAVTWNRRPQDTSGVGTRWGPGVRITLPTRQLRIQPEYRWFRTTCSQTICSWERRASVHVHAKDRMGYDQPPATMDSGTYGCLDPITFPDWGDKVGVPTSAEGVRFAKASKLDSSDQTVPFTGLTVKIGNAASIGQKSCATGYHAPGFAMAGVSLASSADAPLDLNGLTLQNAALPGVDLSWAQLDHADLTGTVPADLSYVDFDNADLTGADLTGANLTGASFDGATVDGMILSKATLYGVDLSKATGTLGPTAGAHFCNTTLQVPPDAAPGTDPVVVDDECDAKLVVATGAQQGVDSTLIDTGGPVPLVLAAGIAGCIAASSVGSLQGLAISPCESFYVSARLPGGPGWFHDGKSVGMRGGGGTMELEYSVPLYGWQQSACLKVMSTAEERCPDKYRPPPGD